MTTKVASWGNGLGLHIPKAVAEHLSLKAGTPLELSIEADGSLLVKPVNQPLSLKELVAKIDENELPENGWSEMKPVGREVW